MRNMICFLLMLVALCATSQDTGRLQGKTDSAATIASDTSTNARKKKSGQQTNRLREQDLLNRISSSDTAVSQQLVKLSEYSVLLSSINSSLRRGFDTSDISEGLNSLEADLDLAREGVLQVQRYYNYRNLLTTKKFIKGIVGSLEHWQEKLHNISARLNDFKVERDQMRNDPVWKNFPEDSVLRAEILNRLTEMNERVGVTDSLMQDAIVNIAALQNRVFRAKLETDDDIEEINFRLEEKWRTLLSKEMGYLWEKPKNKSDFWKDVQFSYKKNLLIFKYYFAHTWQNRILNVLLVLAFWLVIRNAKRKIVEANSQLNFEEGNLLILKYPLLSSLFLVNVFSQFSFVDPPEVFIIPMWLVAATIVVVFRWYSLSPFWRKMLLVLVALVLYVVFDNSLLIGSRTERTGILIVSLVGVVAGTMAFIHAEKSPLISWAVRAAIGLLVVQEFISLVSNLFGRTTLAKGMMTSGFLNLIAAVCLIWWVLLISQFVFAIAEANRKNDRLNSYIDFEDLYASAKPILNVVGMVAWAIIFLRNLNLFQVIWESVADFMMEPRNIGKMQFTFASIVTFFLVIWVSVIIARIVSILVGHDTIRDGVVRKSRIGNTMLLLRLVIISLGFFIAVGAAGIPLDKISLVLGALGVGIGFGLQGLVNNLVSGIILAFEKPLVVGDQVEINGKLGLIKEIGFRSSRLSTYDGAEVIIPNGDLLNNHVINWTKSSNLRRVEIIVGVSYGTDLSTVQSLLQEILSKNKKVVAHPEPNVLLNQFSSSSIDFRILFWADVDSFTAARSELIMEIEKQFQEKNISIPFPQVVVHHVKNDDNNPGIES